jgi:hypothetical protein
MRLIVAALALSVFTAPAAWAQERDYCPARPGLGTPACTIAPGRVSLETGIADWQRDDTPGERSDTIVIGDTLLRMGVSDTVEVQLGWTPFGHVRVRDKASGAVAKASSVGDVLVGLKANLANPDGSGLSIAVQPYAVLPVGGAALGAGDWSAGVVVPVSYDLNDVFNIQFSPEIDAATDGDGRGRHFAYSGTWGLGVSLGDTLGVTAEFQAARDQDPAGHSTALLAGLSAAWMRSDDLQLDIGANLGLNDNAPDVQVYFGFSRRF